MLSIVDMCFFAADLCSPERSFGALHRFSGAGKSGSLELRPTRHSAPRLSPGLRPPTLCRCAERHADLSRPALGQAKAGKALGINASGVTGLVLKSLRTTRAGRRGQWGGCCSVDLGFCQIKEEAEGRGTFAEAFTPLPSASTNARIPTGSHKYSRINRLVSNLRSQSPNPTTS